MGALSSKITSLYVLGYSFSDKIKLIFLALYFALCHRLGIKPIISGKIKIDAFGKCFYFYPSDGSDLAVLREVFLKKEYLSENSNVSTIVDLGSNVGASVAFFKTIYPNARVLACEPDPETFKKLKKNTSQFDSVLLRDYAVSDKKGTIDFYIYPNSSMSSSIYERKSGQQKITAKTISLSELLESENIKEVDILKFDVEGAEFEIFQKPDFLKKTKYLIGEIHEDISGKNLDDFLSSVNGFTVVKKVQTFPKRYIVHLKNNNLT